MTSTLEIESLLNIIIHNARDIFKCKAGGLFLYDQQTRELILKSSFGLDKIKFEGKRLSIDVGVAGRAFRTQQPVIANNVPLFQNWNIEADLKAGPNKQNLLVVPILVSDRILGVIVVINKGDGTYFTQNDQKLLEIFVNQAAISISNAQLFAESRAADITKSEYISLISHELRTPLTSIKGFTDLLAQGTVGPVNDTQIDFLNTIRSNVDRMATIISNLADISRIEDGQMRLEFTAVSIEDAIREVVRSSQDQIDKMEQSFELQIPDDLPAVWGDKDRIIQILTNLVQNSNRYTPSGGHIAVSAEHRINEWDTSDAPEVILISLQDNGYGISSEDQQQIYQKFFRSENQNIREKPGTGLSLNITRHLVEMQGGRIWFESEFGIGTTFSFTLPVSTTT